MITFEKAKELFTYNRETGVIKWRKRTINQRSDLVVGSTRSGGGYMQIRIKGKRYLVHRVAMLLAYGFCGDGLEVDHLNHIRDDNRLANLRFVTRSGNNKNKSRSSNNTTGVTGVIYLKDTRKYRAQIKVDGANICLGSFVTLEEATEVRKAAEIKYKFNVGHGATKIKDYAK